MTTTVVDIVTKAIKDREIWIILSDFCEREDVSLAFETGEYSFLEDFREEKDLLLYVDYDRAIERNNPKFLQ